METIRKIMNIGQTLIDGKKHDLFCKATIEDGVLVISAVAVPNGNLIDGFGYRVLRDTDFLHRSEKDPTLISPKQIKFGAGWGKTKWLNFLALWRRRHRNNMRKNCPHQIGEDWNPHKNIRGKPCPVCGYKYGTKWFREELQPDEIEFIRQLPEATKKPAWI